MVSLPEQANALVESGAPVSACLAARIAARSCRAAQTDQVHCGFAVIAASAILHLKLLLDAMTRAAKSKRSSLQGKSYRFIARQLGVSHRTIRIWLKALQEA